ncbi:hypothetical protein ZWY2020_052350 [Hordeum vulgare]|nr:hypothetical protein ZWY2020_052350 [Hordeum vulgare]
MWRHRKALQRHQESGGHGGRAPPSSSSLLREMPHDMDYAPTAPVTEIDLTAGWLAVIPLEAGPRTMGTDQGQADPEHLMDACVAMPAASPTARGEAHDFLGQAGEAYVDPMASDVVLLEQPILPAIPISTNNRWHPVSQLIASNASGGEGPLMVDVYTVVAGQPGGMSEMDPGSVLFRDLMDPTGACDVTTLPCMQLMALLAAILNIGL